MYMAYRAISAIISTRRRQEEEVEEKSKRIKYIVVPAIVSELHREIITCT